MRRLAFDTSLSLTGVGSTAGVPISSCSAHIASVEGLISKESSSKLNIIYTQPKDSISVVTILYEKTLYKSMIDKRIDEREGEELKRFFNH